MGFLSMLIAFIILLIFTTMFTWSSISLEKKHKKWLEDAKNAYTKNEFASEYPRSQISIFKNEYKYNMDFRLIISAWIILLVCPFIFDVKTYIIIYLINYMYSRILMWLACLELKIDTINDEVYKENKYL